MSMWQLQVIQCCYMQLSHGRGYRLRNDANVLSATTVPFAKLSMLVGWLRFSLALCHGMKCCLVLSGPLLKSHLPLPSCVFLARLSRAPPAVFALLQAAGTEWRDLVISDLVQLKSVLGTAVASLPAHAVYLKPWLDVASQFPV